jgi:hypothetical protein
MNRVNAGEDRADGKRERLKETFKPISLKQW